MLRGIPSTVDARGKSIFVKIGNLNMPLDERQCINLFGKEPCDELEAKKFALRLRVSKREVEFPNIKTKDDKPSRKELLEKRDRKRRKVMKLEVKGLKVELGERNSVLSEMKKIEGVSKVKSVGKDKLTIEISYKYTDNDKIAKLLDMLCQMKGVMTTDEYGYDISD